MEYEAYLAEFHKYYHYDNGSLVYAGEIRMHL